MIKALLFTTLIGLMVSKLYAVETVGSGAASDHTKSTTLFRLVAICAQNKSIGAWLLSAAARSGDEDVAQSLLDGGVSAQ